MRLGGALVVGLGAAMTLAACATGPDSAPQAVQPSNTGGVLGAVGTAVSGGTFTTVVPLGWTNKVADPVEVARVAAAGRVTFLVEQPPPGTPQQGVNDVIGLINVVSLDIPVPDDQVDAYLASVSGSGATNLSEPKAFTVDGATGQYITYDRDVSGTPGESEDMVVNHAGTTFGIVLVTSQSAYALQHTALDDVLTAWRWVD